VLEVGQQLRDAAKFVRRLHTVEMPMVSFAPLIVEADHADAIDDVDKPVFEARVT